MRQRSKKRFPVIRPGLDPAAPNLLPQHPRYPHVDRTQLFDLQSDPFETRDLSADPAQAERIKAMLAKLATEMKANGDNDLLTAVKLQSADCKAPTKLPKPGHKGH